MENCAVLYEIVAAVRFLAVIHEEEHPGLALLLRMIAEKAEVEIDGLL